MSVIKMAEQIKQIHPNYLLIFKVGAFCLTYGKDSYIMAANFNYMLKITSGVQSCGFSKKVLRKVMATLEDRKINYLIIEPRNDYDVEEKSDNKNLNTYEQEFKASYKIVKQKVKIEKIKERLELYIGKDEFRNIIRKVEDVLDENREI